MTDLEPFGYEFALSKCDRELSPYMASINATFSAQAELWNRLVEIEAANRKTYRSIVESGTEEAEAAQAEVRRLEDQIAAMAALPRRDRQKLAEMRLALKGAKAVAKAARAVSAAAQKPALDAVEQERRTAVKQAVRESGLWWCQSEVVTEQYDVARVRAMKTNSELRRANGMYGALRVRWQNGIPLHVLRSGSDTLASLIYIKPGRGSSIYSLKLCIESDRADKTYITVPIVMSRDIPDGSMVRNIRVFRRRVGDRVRWYGAVCVQQPMENRPPREDGDGDIVLTQDFLKDCEKFGRALEHVRWLQHVLDKKAAEFAAATHDQGLTQRIEALLEDRGRKNIIHADIRRLAAEFPAAAEFTATTRRMWNEMHHLRAKAIRLRDEDYRVRAKKLTTSHAKISVEKPMMAFDSKTPDRPAWGRWCEILKQSGKRWGCEVVFFVPEKQNPDANQCDTG